MMFDDFFGDFLDDVVDYESVMPGIVFGEVDVICESCGEVNTYKANPNGSNLYECPKCKEVTEI